VQLSLLIPDVLHALVLSEQMCFK